jgi:hypothetical protein
MSKASVDSESEWLTVAQERPSGLEVVLLKRTYILPWSQFLYAEGGDDEVRAVFATHDILIRGSGLSSLLTELATQRVSRLNEPTRTDRLDVTSSRIVRELRVQKAGERTS